MNRIWMPVVAMLLAVGLYNVRSLFMSAPVQPGISSSPAAAPPDIPSNLPTLEMSDGLVRQRVGTLSSNPMLLEWLKQESLISRLVSAMSMIVNGRFPREIFAAFAPRGKFLVVKNGGKTVIDPAGFARYDALTAMIGKVDAVAAARLFEELLPLFDAAQRGLGEKNTSAREAFFAASRELLQTPVLEGDPVLTQGKKGIGWNYADEKLEGLSPAQKQIMRMGPKNQALVQAKLRAVALALGVPASTL